MKMAQRKTHKPGRKPVGRPRPIEYGDQYQLRLTEEDRARWTTLAENSGMTLAQWIRYHCAMAAGGKVRIVSAEFVVSYPQAAPVAQELRHERSDHDGDGPCAACKDETLGARCTSGKLTDDNTIEQRGDEAC